MIKKDKSSFVNKTYLLKMLPLFYQTHLKSQFSLVEYLLLKILINVLQSIKKVSKDNVGNQGKRTLFCINCTRQKRGKQYEGFLPKRVLN